MHVPLRLAASLALLAAPPPCGWLPSPAVGTGGPGFLRATLRARPAAPRAPAWLEQAVCDRAADLGPVCTQIARAVAEEAAEASLDPALVLAIIEVESAWDPDAVSGREARGLMQLRQQALQAEARGGRLTSSDASDPLVNVRAGIRYFARLLGRFGDAELALVAYNAGPNRLAAYLRAEAGVPERLWEYPRRVRREEQRLRERLAAPLAPAALLAVAGNARTGG
ncbi:MAG TPA: lytic transglycosylase domain-containing protein [Anaeromyxobacter sp.]|nr:lytic transglycosylase domain-containing protein [Anaeromyxobacter sp.]